MRVAALYLPACITHSFVSAIRTKEPIVTVKKLHSLVAKQEKALAKIDAALGAALEVHGQINLTLASMPAPNGSAAGRGPRPKTEETSSTCD